MAKRVKRYEERIVLFLDFLGFKEIVERTRRDAARLDDLLGAIDRLHAIGREDADLYGTQAITTFSDCVALSYAVNEQSAVYYLLSDVAFAVIDLAIKGFLVRGAVTIGDLLHTRKYLVGPAMVRAHELESKVAKYPRVLLDPRLVGIARKAHADQHDAYHEAKYVREFLTQDTDKQHYFDYISWKPVVEKLGMDDDNYPAYLSNIKDLIRDGLKKDNPHILAKYLWMHERYVKAIRQFECLGPNHQYRVNNPENYAAVVGLPKFVNEVKRAHSIVATAGRRLRSRTI
jgi:hypothetical protein